MRHRSRNWKQQMRTNNLLLSVAAFALTTAILTPLCHGAEREITDPREKELRAAAANEDPAAIRELACYLYYNTRKAPENLADAIAFMRQAADAGDDLASLFAASYLHFGLRGKPDEDAA